MDEKLNNQVTIVCAIAITVIMGMLALSVGPRLGALEQATGVDRKTGKKS